jgi:hypothetical protein
MLLGARIDEIVQAGIVADVDHDEVQPLAFCVSNGAHMLHQFQ